jgi:hemerythrin-like domain-containing protein
LKRHKALYRLSHDHQHGLVLALKLKYKKNPTSSSLELEVGKLKQELIQRFENDLRIHFKMEESCFKPLFKRNELLQRMHDEHKKLEVLYNKISLNTEGWNTEQQREKLNLFGELLDFHIRFEERELFPMIENLLTEEQLKTMGEKLQ